MRNHVSIVNQGRAGTLCLYKGGTTLAWGNEMNWFCMYIPAALACAGLWPGIPMRRVLKRPDRGQQPQVVPAPQRSEQPAGV